MNNTNKKEKKQIKKSFHNKNTRKLATLSTGIIIGFIAIVVAFNVVLNLLVERYPLKLDLTNEKIYQLTDDSIDLLKSVKIPITITFMSEESSLPTYYSELLANYKRYCPNLTVKYVDAVKNPDYLAKQKFTNVTSSTIAVVSSEKRYKGLESSDFYDENSNSTAEKAISSGIIYVTKDVVYDILLVTGHGETYSASFKSLLSGNGYNVVETNIKNAQVSENTKALIINSPTSDFSADDVDSLDTIMTNNEKYGRNTFLFAGTSTPKLDKLESYLAEWGISYSTEKVIEGTSKLIPLYGLQMLTYGDETLAGSAKNYDFYAGIGEVRPVSILFEQKGAVNSVKSILKSSTDAFGKAANAEIKSTSDLEKADGDKSGPFDIAAMATKLTYDSDNNALKGNFIVSGTTAFTEDSLITTSSVGNSRFLVNLINSAVGLEDSDIAIVAKTVTAEKLNITGNTVSLFTVIFIFVLPIAIILAGVIIFLKRKHL